MTRLEFYQEVDRRRVAQGLKSEDLEIIRQDDPASMRYRMTFMVRGREFARASCTQPPNVPGNNLDELEYVEWAKAPGEPNLQFKGINKWRNLYEEAPSQDQV